LTSKKLVRYIILAVYLFTLVTNGVAQRKHYTQYVEPSAYELLRDQIACECFVHNKYSEKERLNIYPFNKAAQVMLISFDVDEGIPVKSNRLNEQEITEKVVLSHKDIDSLTNIFYNIGFTPLKGAQPYANLTSCYEPRNGVLFLDDNGKVFEYLEMCFACKRQVNSSKKINDGEYCSTKFDLLQLFFNKAGIKYGTNERNPALTYQDIFNFKSQSDGIDTVDAISALRNKLEKKTAQGHDLRPLSKTELTLFFAFNADVVYDGSTHMSGLTKFYAQHSGNFYNEILNSLDEIGAHKTCEALKTSKWNWPGNSIPQSLVQRRESLLKFINTANPKWENIEKELFICEDEFAARICTPKENLSQLIFNYALTHRGALLD